MSVGKRLKELRITNDLSQKEMAELLEVSLSGYQNYEHGGRDIPTSVLARAMEKFGVDANWLFGEVPREQGGKGTGETATPTEQSLSAMDFETFIRWVAATHPDVVLHLRSILQNRDKLTERDKRFLMDSIAIAVGRTDDTIRERMNFAERSV